MTIMTSAEIVSIDLLNSSPIRSFRSSVGRPVRHRRNAWANVTVEVPYNEAILQLPVSIREGRSLLLLLASVLPIPQAAWDHRSSLRLAAIRLRQRRTTRDAEVEIGALSPRSCELIVHLSSSRWTTARSLQGKTERMASTLRTEIERLATSSVAGADR
jgi:hypothetical protein